MQEVRPMNVWAYPRSLTMRRRTLAVLTAALLLVSAAGAEDATKATGGDDDATKLAKGRKTRWPT